MEFTSVIVDGLEKPMYLLCMKYLVEDSMRPGKLRGHLTTVHAEYIDKPKEFFQRKLDEYNKQKEAIKKNSLRFIKVITGIVSSVL